MRQFDFTVYFTREELRTQLGDRSKAPAFASLLAPALELPRAPTPDPGAYRYSGKVTAPHGVYRALICRCDGDTGYSGTFRRIEGSVTPGHLPHFRRLKQPSAPSPPTWPEHGFRAQTPPSDLVSRAGRRKGRFVFAIEDVVDVLAKAIANQDNESDPSLPPDGLIVITGRTGAGKSKIAEGLIDLHLRKLAQTEPSRWPHLVTLQDPIESRFAPSLKAANAARVDYTPRELHQDCPSVADCVEDALRQTPAVLYVGEIRRREDWGPAFRFAASGHLCVTTAHAGSLVEGMRMLVETLGAQTADSRSAMARKLRAVVHLKAARTPDEAHQYCLPALWCRCDRSVASLVSDGLASILPHCSPPGRPGWRGCLGRRYLFDRLLEGREKAGLDPESVSRLTEEVRPQATAWDLLGE